ncbi:hypothetical protein [Convivina intestini]|uniref:Uncharacterized protein n=1 Tax=Convivina intestini TaxID=1505726 RepID=A0A2U1D3F4_9LACO|nr:hypothetical protein [Convivina intestini]PVY82207.1 hypothetical protein C7384_11510 [Convivina intestini]CAH1857568.1 hypothetical protein R077811_01591 [Convivina intestini]SDC22784.1 hypothetical protein SAMN05216341_1259 [Leuconostocaceae bacterium R-53105]
MGFLNKIKSDFEFNKKVKSGQAYRASSSVRIDYVDKTIFVIGSITRPSRTFNFDDLKTIDKVLVHTGSNSTDYELVLFFKDGFTKRVKNLFRNQMNDLESRLKSIIEENRSSNIDEN